MAARRVLVTGAASGIGAATVRRFRADGAAVAGLDADSGALASLAVDVRVETDVADADAVEAAVDAAAAALGGLDVLVCSAGVIAHGTVLETAPDEWDRLFAVNVRGIYLCARAAIPHLRRAGGGAIVTVASQLGLVAQRRTAAYCAAKGAVLQLTRALALDHAADGIRVNAVCPGPTLTPMVTSLFSRAELDEYSATVHAHGRMVEPDEIADAIAYLASPSAGSTIGAALVVDGGYSIR
jgi:NAD(P)-dependent dehydrogenase (short-subunit alcohol dehydrogenase family)